MGEGFVEAKDLKISDKLLLSSGKRVIIEKLEVETLEMAETTYNFEVADFHTYYVTESNVLVHNKCTYDIDKLYKTQPDELLDERLVVNNMEKIASGGVDAVESIPIYVDKGNALLLDGHHRLEAFRRLGYKRVPIKYVHKYQLVKAPYFRNLNDLRALMHK